MSGFRNIVAGVDLSRADRIVAGGTLGAASRAAVECASDLARRSGAALHLLSALDVDPIAESIVRRAAGPGRTSILEQARAFVEHVAEVPRAMGVKVTTSVEFGGPVDLLIADVEIHGRDLVVVGTRERSSVARNVLGSTALRLLRRCPVPVWVARDSRVHAGRTVLAAVGIGDLAVPVLRIASAVAAALEASLHVLHVVDLPAEEVLRAGAADLEVVASYRKQQRERAESDVPALVHQALGAGAKVDLHLVDADTPAAAILDHAGRLEAEVVVLGSVVHGGLRTLLLGSTTEKLLPALETSLLLVKPT